MNERRSTFARAAKATVGAVALLAVGGAALAFTLGSTRGAPVVKTARVTTGQESALVRATGQVVAGPGAYADIYPPTTGTLDEVWVEDGQRVRAGQRLARLDTDPLLLQMAEAKAARAQALSALSVARIQAATPRDVSAAKENVSAMRVLYDNAKAAYELACKTDGSSGAPGALAAMGVMRQAKAGLAQARATLEKAERSVSTRDQRIASEAGQRQADAAYRLARKYADAAVLVAPIDGVVMFNALGAQAGTTGRTPSAAVGAAVTPQLAPFSVVDLSRAVFSAEIDEGDAGLVAVGSAASVTLDAHPGRPIAAKVARIVPTAQRTQTGGTVFIAELELVGSSEQVLIGMKGDADVQCETERATLRIPADAALSENGSDYVFKVVGDRLVRTEIVLGRKSGESVEVLKGLGKGDVVALPGTEPFEDGTSVRSES